MRRFWDKARRRLAPDGAGAVPALESPHAGVVEADPYAFQASHRRLAWMLRLAVATNVVLGFIVVVLGNAVAVLVPLKETKFALVRTYAPDDKLYRVEPIAVENASGFNLLLEATARRYVKLLLEIDGVTQEARMEEAFRISARDLWERFRRDRIQSGRLTEAIKRGLRREIHLESTDKIQTFGNEHKIVVRFTQTDTEGGKVTVVKKLDAFMTIEARPQEVREADRYTNPLGFFVKELVLKKRNG